MSRENIETLCRTVLQCHEYKNINCILGEKYPYCDMTCPMNTFAKKMYDHRNSSDIERPAENV